MKVVEYVGVGAARISSKINGSEVKETHMRDDKDLGVCALWISRQIKNLVCSSLLICVSRGRFDVSPTHGLFYGLTFLRDGPITSTNSSGASPDGSCFLTSSDDNAFRLFGLPSNADEIKEDACSSSVDDDSYAANLMAFDSHRNEKEVRVALERTQTSLAEALERTEQGLNRANQKIMLIISPPEWLDGSLAGDFGVCKFGAACKFYHPRDKQIATQISLNMLGFPMRRPVQAKFNNAIAMLNIWLILSVALSVDDWFFDRVGVSAIDCPYPCDNTCHNLVFKGLNGLETELRNFGSDPFLISNGSETEIMHSVSDPLLIRDGSKTEWKNFVFDPSLISNKSETDIMHSISDPLLVRDGSETECINSVSDPFLISNGSETKCNYNCTILKKFHFSSVSVPFLISVSNPSLIRNGITFPFLIESASKILETEFIPSLFRCKSQLETEFMQIRDGNFRF
ncbi:hypothetical protein Syun_029555 [Stephania yunnanensis]|uniref:C3H1-type domain-containing protein n=1 Tax=Stephania yunnanensis TaxID=152371 RepID=A0AAP0E5U3_9MAGN